MAKPVPVSQISAFISRPLKERLERMLRARGFKQGAIVERALEHHLRALEEIPEEYIVPPVLEVTPEAFRSILDRLAHPAKPGEELRRLMRGEPVDDAGLD
jgi:hypothetical protein